MESNYVRKSSVAAYIDSFIQEKRSSGFAYETAEQILNRFDEYCFSRGLQGTGITREFLDGWMERRETEGGFQQTKRISCVRQFLLFMASYGFEVYIPHDFNTGEKPAPHLFTREELTDFFHVVDEYRPRPNRPDFEERMAGEYRMIFRLYCCCGLRNSEAAGIASENVDLQDNVLTILDSKGQKDRLVYMPDDLADSCRDYYDWLKRKLGFNPEWFFPGQDPLNPIPNKRMDVVFRRYWEKTRYAGCNNKPTIHDFRFTFVVNRINLWAEEGQDLNVMMPYLSRYLGHKSIHETMYYYYLVRDAYKTVEKKDTIAGAVIPEVRNHE